MNQENLDKLIQQVKEILDDAYSRGFPLIIVEPQLIPDLQERLAVMSFIHGYVQQKKDELAYLASRN